VEAEPDYRFSLANERTVLAWFRTALALLAASVAVAQLVPEFGVPGARASLSVFLGVLSAFSSVGGVWRWYRVQKAMRRGEPLPRSSLIVVQGAGLAAVAVAVVLLVINS